MSYESSERLRAAYQVLNRDWVGAMARHQIEMEKEMTRIKAVLTARGDAL